jgi:hypothetical protein
MPEVNTYNTGEFTLLVYPEVENTLNMEEILKHFHHGWIGHCESGLSLWTTWLYVAILFLDIWVSCSLFFPINMIKLLDSGLERAK